jgi:hypothetical protein
MLPSMFPLALPEWSLSARLRQQLGVPHGQPIRWCRHSIRFCSTGVYLRWMSTMIPLSAQEEWVGLWNHWIQGSEHEPCVAPGS